MNLGLENNKKIAEKYCLNPQGCPKLKGKTDYNEKLTICASCNNYLNKIDLIELLQYYTTSTAPSKPQRKAPYKGKSTELNKPQIEQILLYDKDGWTKNKIATEMRLHFTTVKNVLELGFKNDLANEKVKKIIDEMKNDGLL